MHLVGLLIYTLQYDARCIQRQTISQYYCMCYSVDSDLLEDSSLELFELLYVSEIFHLHIRVIRGI